ncbi:MAG: flagellar biosynthetic protein FliR [Agarilytica sp.]
MSYSDADVAAFIQQYMLPLFRIAAMFMVMPIIGARTVPARARLALALTVTLLIVPLLPPLPQVPSLSLPSLLFAVQEVLIGITVGFIFQVVFQVFVLSGQFMAMKMGLGFASMNDPTNGVQTTVISQFFLMLVTMMFVSVDGHVVLIHLIVESFQTMPPGVWIVEPGMFKTIVDLGSWMFSAALVFSLPVLTSLLFVNIAFGVMSRAAPQLNIFAVGFPFTLVVGLALIWVGLLNFVPAFDNIISFGFLSTESLLRIR